MRVMDARARPRVPVFEKAHARMKLLGRVRAVAERAGWLTLTEFQVAFAFYNKEKPIKSVDVPLL